jgi:putative endonuclease
MIKYNITKLIHLEQFSAVEEAIHRERCIKKWNRQWNLRLIEENNPEWDDLYDSF